MQSIPGNQNMTSEQRKMQENQQKWQTISTVTDYFMDFYKKKFMSQIFEIREDRNIIYRGNRVKTILKLNVILNDSAAAQEEIASFELTSGIGEGENEFVSEILARENMLHGMFAALYASNIMETRESDKAKFETMEAKLTDAIHNDPDIQTDINH